MNNLEAFYTKDLAEEGVMLPLDLPDGTPTEHWIRVRSVDSDAFRIAEAHSKRAALRIAANKELDDNGRILAARDTEFELIAALVVSWSFDMECTTSTVAKFLKQAPQIADEINKFACRRSLFYKGKSKSSTDGSEGSSSSNEGQKDPKSPSEST